MEPKKEKFDLRGFEFLLNGQKNEIAEISYAYGNTEKVDLMFSRLNADIALLRSRFTEISKPTRVEISPYFRETLILALQVNHFTFETRTFRIYYRGIKLTPMIHLIGGEINVGGYQHIWLEGMCTSIEIDGKVYPYADLGNWIIGDVLEMDSMEDIPAKKGWSGHWNWGGGRSPLFSV